MDRSFRSREKAPANEDGPRRSSRSVRAPERFGLQEPAARRDYVSEKTARINSKQDSRRNRYQPDEDRRSASPEREDDSDTRESLPRNSLRNRRQRGPTPEPVATTSESPTTTSPDATTTNTPPATSQDPTRPRFKTENELIEWLKKPKPDGFFPEDFFVAENFNDLPQRNPTPPLPPRPAGVERMPDLSKLTLKNVPTTFAAPDNQVWIPSFSQVQEILDSGDYVYDRAHFRKEGKRWCHCVKAELPGWDGSIECEDPKCRIVWFHWECLSDLERKLAKTFKTWICIRCWAERASEIFGGNPYRSMWPENVTGIKEVPAMFRRSLVKNLNKAKAAFDSESDGEWSGAQISPAVRYPVQKGVAEPPAAVNAVDVDSESHGERSRPQAVPAVQHPVQNSAWNPPWRPIQDYPDSDSSGGSLGSIHHVPDNAGPDVGGVDRHSDEDSSDEEDAGGKPPRPRSPSIDSLLSSSHGGSDGGDDGQNVNGAGLTDEAAIHDNVGDDSFDADGEDNGVYEDENSHHNQDASEDDTTSQKANTRNTNASPQVPASDDYAAQLASYAALAEDAGSLSDELSFEASTNRQENKGKQEDDSNTHPGKQLQPAYTGLTGSFSPSASPSPAPAPRAASPAAMSTPPVNQSQRVDIDLTGSSSPSASPSPPPAPRAAPPAAISTPAVTGLGRASLSELVNMVAPQAEVQGPPPPLYHSVHSQEGLEQSAQIWTNEHATVSIDESIDPPQIVLRYKYGEIAPYPTTSADLATIHEDGSFIIGAALLARFSPIIDSEAKSKGDDAVRDASITFPNISAAATEACIYYIQGSSLCITLPTSSPVPLSTIKLLLEYAHFAHALAIQPLMNAVMHALMVIVHRDPTSFTDELANKRLLEDHTSNGNPARKALRAPIHPELHGNAQGGLRCVKGYPYDMCEIDIKSAQALWIAKEVTGVLKKRKQEAPKNLAGSFVVPLG